MSYLSTTTIVDRNYFELIWAIAEEDAGVYSYSRSQLRPIAVLFWGLDRFSREGTTKTIAYLQQLDGYGVKFKSLTEPFFDSDNELVTHILPGVLSCFAQLGAKKISISTKAELAQVKAQEKH